MIAPLSAMDDLRSARAAGGHHGKALRIIIDPKANRTTLCRQLQDQTGLWKPLFNAKGEGTVSAPDGRARCHEGGCGPGGGLMLRGDGSGLLWGGKGEMLTQVERISKKTILAAGLRPELTFTSLGRHGGATCHARGRPRNRLPAARRILGRTRIETWGEVV